jgi:hypothetical protein
MGFSLVVDQGEVFDAVSPLSRPTPKDRESEDEEEAMKLHDKNQPSMISTEGESFAPENFLSSTAACRDENLTPRVGRSPGMGTRWSQKPLP